MKAWKKILGTSLVLGCSLLLLSACGGGSDKKASGSADGKTKLTFWNGFTASDGEILQGIVNDFNKENDKGITIEMDVMTWANLNEKLPPAISSKTGPDFMLLNYGDFAQYVKNGAVQPLDDFWDYKGVDKSDFTKTALELGTIDEQQYYIPMQVQGMYTYWNKDLFKAAGLDENKPPKTWDELTEMAPKLTDASKNVSGFVFNKDGTAPLYNWILANGGKLVNDDYTKSEFASPKTLEVLKKIQTMIHTDKTGPESISGAEMDNLMNAGQLAIELNGPWLNNGLKKNEINYGVTTIPQLIAGKDEHAILDGVGFGIPASTDDSKKDAIYEFIKYWNTTEIGKKWSMENGFPPYLKSVSEDAEVKADPIVSELGKQITFAKPFLPGFDQLPSINNDIMNPLIEKLLAGDDPEKLMKDADKAINDMLANN
ncbi:ABC transporter substrate-binding protein [Candidatus Enterococcus ikei]|uniref:ABC transporter substrate-binding protein n=1 Tax=Candidatus Enterococcus ikei TaxID=2815326 RepID=A0ABS3GZF2_9ENTE|nr:ABC transporter substrate-binding protein [Enterococcus sp. DIV0869a]MBO0440136.1 ABC transporter substrate-binding protein [Enterococcus sp. DIV0869a]